MDEPGRISEARVGEGALRASGFGFVYGISNLGKFIGRPG
jgi:hypothetical protein